MAKMRQRSCWSRAADLQVPFRGRNRRGAIGRHSTTPRMHHQRSVILVARFGGGGKRSPRCHSACDGMVRRYADATEPELKSVT